jgi:hypothetical protein
MSNVSYPFLLITNQSVDALDIAEVIRAREGRLPPGNIYSFIKSELLLYSLYLSFGIEINCAQRQKLVDDPLCPLDVKIWQWSVQRIGSANCAQQQKLVDDRLCPLDVKI